MIDSDGHDQWEDWWSMEKAHTGDAWVSVGGVEEKDLGEEGVDR